MLMLSLLLLANTPGCTYEKNVVCYESAPLGYCLKWYTIEIKACPYKGKTPKQEKKDTRSVDEQWGIVDAGTPYVPDYDSVGFRDN